ncbi:MAG: carbonic anhydrase [Azospirillum sp.]|nr:carbonic anhydrase [Azospirillum sp.]
MTTPDSKTTGIALCGHPGCPAAACTDRPRALFGLSRRRLLRTGVSVGAAGMLGAAGLSMTATPAAALLSKTPETPDAALAALMEGNQRFTSGGMTQFEADLVKLRAKAELGQSPFAAVLTCADSRVPPEMVFDVSLGEMFVARIAGNIATSEIIASLEYGAAVLGTKVILVMGHESCGAVKAALTPREAPGQISSLFSFIRPAIREAGGDLMTAIKRNAKNQADTLREASPTLADLHDAGKLRVIASYYDLGTGAVQLLD